jgi:SAM-dependent methyltransferase
MDDRYMQKPGDMIAIYDRLAATYADHFCDELDGKPFDRNILQRLAQTAPAGPLCDLGCGPGHVAAYLGALRSDVTGIDVSPGMIAEARSRYPSVSFQIGDMLDLKMEPGRLGGIVAFYSIIHLSRDSLQTAFCEMNRVLRPGGLLLVSFHEGRGELHEDKVLDTPVSFCCTLFESGEIASAMEKSGFSVLETTTRKPYEFEYPTQRVYIMAKKRPADSR